MPAARTRLASVPSLPSPTTWSNQDLVLYHGTVDTFAAAILRKVDPSKGRLGTDFGQGFYTTTLERQARAWAVQLAARRTTGAKPVLPAVIRFDVPRDDLAALEAAWFIRGAYDADEFWSLVWHCRNCRPAHARTSVGPPPDFYELAIGPVAAIWRQSAALYDSDQISFHTVKAADVLNRLPVHKKQVIP